ncbi:MAG: superoxide reductase [Methanobacteriota archaeon]|nr:MAG: superoxide reductase [Euryarchaeota archaeon]
MAEKGLFCGLNRPADPQNLSEMEKKHIPVIDCPEVVKAGEPFKVTVRVGEVPHVMEEGHHIQWIDLYSGSNFLAKVLLTPAFTRAEATVTLVKAGKHRRSTLRALERCNLHGLWEGTKEIEITGGE